MMELIIKHFSQLTVMELYEIYKLRTNVFVVEQNCAYQEVDDYDKLAYHLWLKEDDNIIAYARVLPKNTVFEEASIGRVISVSRRKGYGTRIVQEAIKLVKEKYNADKIMIEAQVYAKSLYEKVGFKQVSDIFLEDGIPHIKMLLLI